MNAGENYGEILFLFCGFGGSFIQDIGSGEGNTGGSAKCDDPYLEFGKILWLDFTL